MTAFMLASLLTTVESANGPLAAKLDWPDPNRGQGVEVVEQLGARVPTQLTFTTHEGQAVTLGSLLQSGKPVVITPVYYACPVLCPTVLRGVVGALKMTGLSLGDDYRIVTFSIDSTETPAQAAEKRLTLMHALGYPSGKAGWEFLVGDEHNVRALTEALGFRYRYDERLKQFAHAASFMVLTPDGRLSRYLYGVQYPPRDVRLALVEASGGKVGTAFDRVLLTCVQFDPTSRRYEFWVKAYLRLGGLLVLGALSTLLFSLWRREARSRKATYGNAA